METSIIAMSNVTSLPECILELVLNSLNANATSIAIRIHGEQRKIQVIDNGRGISRGTLQDIAEYNEQRNCWSILDICNLKKQTLVNIRRLSNAMLITSRYYNSFKTYIKIFKMYQAPKTVKTQRRISHGTTISIYGFYELSLNMWDVPLMCLLIANIAMVNLQVSFSIRDDQQKKVILRITKQHRPIEIFKFLYNKEISINNLLYIKDTKESDAKFCAYIGLTNTELSAKQYVFLNNRFVHCPLILQMISAIFINTLHNFARKHYWQIPKKETIFILLFITCEEYFFTIEKGKKTLVLPILQDLLHTVRSAIVNIFVENAMSPFNSDSNQIIEHRIYSCINHLTKTSKQGCILHSLCNIIKKKITEIEVPLIQGNAVDKRNVSIVKSCEQLKLNNILTQKEWKNNETGYEITTNQLKSNEITNTVQLFTPVSQTNNVTKETVTLTLSEWSNWTYLNSGSHTVNKINKFNNNSRNFYKHFDFLPLKLHKLLRGISKLTKTNTFNESCESIFSVKLKYGLPIQDTLLHQEMGVRPCKNVQKFREFRLKKDLLKFVTILGQMNNELLVGLIVHNDSKVLLLMDQHAIHERIRYEYLIHKYKSETRDQLFYIKLKHPIMIQLPTEKCNLLLSNTVRLNKFGISLSIVSDNTVMVHTVPECLKRNKYRYDEMKLKLKVQNLLNEVLENCTNNECRRISDLPLTIHNAIAMEACHGIFYFVCLSIIL
ncbi:DNA mismatch repair protein Mlh3-like isoform X1 [Hylaeus anthracinus]|uniref:DNA mismatch repair protein Mlh3-like isoform X1 n=1 Tax=Hylaeus anthracinus TaxID=313031 RepID=UPI0023B9928F|nr:DNA mismatch repair protein Mlh3-like isoform X1 [Hylaeus anthracinus]